MENNINVMICSFGDRIQNITKILQKPRSDVRYIVSHQSSDIDNQSFLEFANRDDVRYIYMVLV